MKNNTIKVIKTNKKKLAKSKPFLTKYADITNFIKLFLQEIKLKVKIDKNKIKKQML